MCAAWIFSLRGFSCLFTVIFSGILVKGTTNTSTDEPYKVLTRMAEEADKRARPYHNDRPLTVTVQFFIVAFGPVKEKEFTFEVDFFMRKWWHDPRLAIGGNETLRINANPYDFIWVPDAQFTNSRSTSTHKLLAPTTQLLVKPSGDIYVSTRVTGEFSCNMDLRYYPMDTQTCVMRLESYSFSVEDIILEWKKPDGIELMKGALHLSSYSVTDLQTMTTSHVYGRGENFTTLVVLFTVKRSFVYYMYQIYLPSSCLVCLSWGNLWLPAEAVPARVTLIVTTFLATVFILQGASSEITKVDYITALEIFLCINFVSILLMMLEYLIVVNKKEKGMRQMKFSQLKIKKNEKDNKLDTEMEIYFRKQYERVDDVSKVIFPVGYIIVMASYLLFYAIKTNLFSKETHLEANYAG